MSRGSCAAAGRACRRHFSIRTGTALARSQLPLTKSVLALGLFKVEMSGRALGGEPVLVARHRTVSSRCLHRYLVEADFKRWFPNGRDVIAFVLARLLAVAPPCLPAEPLPSVSTKVQNAVRLWGYASEL
jgi:hypothetical protein